MTTAPVRAAISAMGVALGPDVLARCETLFASEQLELAAAVPCTASDLAYGEHERHRLDIYAPDGAEALPVLVFVHGGGFLKGDKGSATRWPNAAVGRMAARAGFVGVVINYRLAPDKVWPSGAEDVAAVIDWLSTNVASHGGDPARIVLMGTSAGAVHVAGALKLRPELEQAVRGAVLLSGLYGFTPLDPRDEFYYGPDALYPERMPREALVKTTLPLLIACAEFDPPRFQTEFTGLLGERLSRHGALPRAYIASGHNHYSMAMHLGTSDTRLADEVVAFVQEVTS